MLTLSRQTRFRCVLCGRCVESVMGAAAAGGTFSIFLTGTLYLQVLARLRSHVTVWWFCSGPCICVAGWRIRVCVRGQRHRFGCERPAGLSVLWDPAGSLRRNQLLCSTGRLDLMCD